MRTGLTGRDDLVKRLNFSEEIAFRRAILYRNAPGRRNDVVPLPVHFKSVMLGGEQLGSGA